MKPVTYDKPRIVSTIILGIIVTAFVFLTIVCMQITMADVRAATENAANNANDGTAEGAAGAVVAGGAVALVMALGIVLIAALQIGMAVASGVCLIFTIKNRKSILKPIRIISYVMDGLFGAVILCAILKIIFIAVGI